MGGRGGASGFLNNKNALDKNAKEITIESYYRRKYRSYGVDVIEAKEDSAGNIVFERPYAEFDNSNPNANTVDVTFKIKNGAVTDAKGRTTFYGINWDKVKSVSGQTYDIKGEIKEKGFKWDRVNKKWVRE